MQWNQDIQQRFTALRLRELSGTLTESEQDELDRMLEALEQAERVLLAASDEQWQAERTQLLEILRSEEEKNDELRRRIRQQEALVKILSELASSISSGQDNE